MIADLIEQQAGAEPAALDGLVRSEELAARAAQARRSVAIAAAEARQVWTIDGHHSMRAYLRGTCNWSDAEVTRELGLARLIDRAPEVGDALLAGHIGIPQAVLLARVHRNPRVRELLLRAMPALLDHAEHLPYQDFKTCVERWVMLADLDGALDRLAYDIERRTAHVVAVGSTVEVGASGGDPLQAERLIRIFERFVEAEFRRDAEARRAEFGDAAEHHPLPRTAAQRRFDALAAIFDAAHAALDAAGSDDSSVEIPVPDPVVDVVIDRRTLDEAFTRAGLLLPNGNQLDIDEFESHHLRTLIDQFAADPADLVDRRCETASGIPVHPVLALQAVFTGWVRRVVVDSPGVVIDRGRRQRLFGPGAKLAASLLAQHCSHLGCDIPASLCDVDHMEEWVRDGGATDQDNADLQCGGHDRFKHAKRWRSLRATNGRVYNLRPDGTIVLPVGERPPDLTVDEMNRIARRRVREMIAERPMAS